MTMPISFSPIDSRCYPLHNYRNKKNSFCKHEVIDLTQNDAKDILRNFFNSPKKTRIKYTPFMKKRRINYTLFMSALAKVYGKKLTDRIGDLDFLKKKKVELLKKSKKGKKVVTISRKTAALAMVAINSQVSMEDIKEYRKNNPSDNKSVIQLANCVFKNPFSFLGLGDNFMSNEIKNLRLKKKKLEKDCDYFFNHSKNKKMASRNSTEYIRQSHIIKAKSMENLARGIAYAKPERMKTGKIITKYDNNSDKNIAYKLKKSIHNNGLHAYVFVPVDDDNQPALLLFRGTDDQKSLSRDLALHGIGKKEFNESASALLEATKDYKNIQVAGHSLGGADAQRYAILRAEYEKNNAEGFTMDVFAFCSPKLDRETIEELESKHTGKPNKNVKVNMAFIQNDRDIVTKSGYSNVPNIGPFACTYFLNKRRYAYVNLQAHSESILDTATFERPKIRKDSMETLIMGMADTSVGSNSKQIWQKTECHHYPRNAEKTRKQDKMQLGRPFINALFSLITTNFSDVIRGNGVKKRKSIGERRLSRDFTHTTPPSMQIRIPAG